MSAYKIFKYLFGWDYILWENSCSAGTARVNIDGDGVAYYKTFTYGITRIKYPGEVIWLTCPSDKYIKGDS